MSIELLMKVGAGTLDLDRLIPNTRDGGFHPHRVDFYIPNGTLSRALVLMHGGTGNKWQMARQMNVLLKYQTPTSSIVNWSPLAYFNTVVVCPQGMAPLGPGMARTVDANGNPLTTWPAGGNPWNPTDLDSRTPGYPDGVTTWSNWFMWSGADDKQFLKDLKAYIVSTFGIASVACGGHSSGGFMTKTMWIEEPATFGHHITWAGPPAEHYASVALPGTKRKLLCFDGALDYTIGVLDYYDRTTSHLHETEWLQTPENRSRADVTYPERARNHSDWTFLQRRVFEINGITPAIGDAVTTAARIGTKRVWSYDGGNHQFIVIDQADHDLVNMTKCYSKYSMFVVAMLWIVGTS
jgi:hypothetical protein